MKTYDLKDIFPPKVKITKDGNYLEISGNEDLVQENHAFVFTSVYDFERTNNKSFIKKTDDFEATLRIVSEYLKEQKFEFTGDAACQEIINRLDSSEKDFYIAQRRGQEIKNSNVADLHVPHFIRSRRLKIIPTIASTPHASYSECRKFFNSRLWKNNNGICSV